MVFTINWLIFSLAYSGKTERILSPILLLTWVIPVATTILLLIFPEKNAQLWNDYSILHADDGFYRIQILARSPVFWLNWAQAYTLILTGAIIILRTSISSPKEMRSQSRLAFLSVVLPLIANLLYIIGLLPEWVRVFSLFSFSISGLLLAISIYRFRLFDLGPIARSNLIDTMPDAMLVFDSRNHLVDRNPAASLLVNGPIGQLSFSF